MTQPAFSFMGSGVEDSLELDGGLDDFDVTLRIHDSKSVTPDPERVGGLQYEEIPHIAVTPMTPPSGSVSPDDGHSTVSLNSSCTGSPMFQPRMGLLNGGDVDGELNNAWARSESPMHPQNEVEAKDFFAYRDSILNNVISEVHETINFNTDGAIKGTWLLTEIDSWNHEWERIVILCYRVLVIGKHHDC